MTTVGFGGGSILAAGLIIAGAAARRNSPAALDRALGIENRLAGVANSDHLERLAELNASEANDAQAKMVLQRALRLDPRRTTAWITLGLLEERTGDRSAAEQALLEAARVDHQYLPAWTLANFYFRQENREEFWKWACRASVLTYDEFPPLLRLADHFDSDPASVLTRLKDSARLERGYLTYLISRDRWEAIAAVASRLSARHDPADAPRFDDLATRGIAAEHAEAALAFWNVFHTPALDPVRGPFLTDPDFQSPATGQGFDWALSGSACRGVAIQWSPGRIRFDLSGGQPDTCTLLTQALILFPRPRGHPGKYQLSFEYRAEGQSAPSGLDWELVAHPEQEVSREPSAPFLFQSGTGRQRWVTAQRVFEGARGPLAHLRFFYRRPPGTVRYEGSVWLRQLHWELL